MWHKEGCTGRCVSAAGHSNGNLAGFIESWGRGIEKICSACEEDGVPLPEYTINPGDIMIKFTAPEDRVIRSGIRKVTEKVTERVTETDALINTPFLGSH